MSAGSLILLNGTPSSGKTTLARALTDAFPEPVFFQSLDDFRMSVPERFWIGPDVQRLFGSLLDAWLAMLRDVADHGIPVVAESAITPVNRERYDELFTGIDVVLVGVTCPLDIVLEREGLRSDRLNGRIEITADDLVAVHSDRDYALEIDTSTEPTSRSVERILEAVDNLRRLSG